MATKKKIIKKVQEAPFVPEEGVAPAPKKRSAALSEERTHRLRKDQLMKWRMLEAELESLQAKFQMAEMRLSALVNSRPDIVAAQTFRREAQEMFRKKRDEYQTYMGELGQMLGLNMKNVAIDETTGLVKELPSGSEGEPTP